MRYEAGRLKAIEDYRFPEPLREGIVVARPNRFIMDVEIDGRVERCHCPVVSRIGRLNTEGRPCLLSESANPRRKFAKTVEALSLDEPKVSDKSWIGINQTASNRYLEHFLSQGAFVPALPEPRDLRREVRVGDSRLDFALDDALFVEVKTPLVQLQLPIPEDITLSDEPVFSSTERALRHLRCLADSLQAHERAVIIYSFYYDNPGFRFYHGTTYDEVRETVETVQQRGVEFLQANFEFTPEGVHLARFWPMTFEWDETGIADG